MLKDYVIMFISIICYQMEAANAADQNVARLCWKSYNLLKYKILPKYRIFLLNEKLFKYLLVVNNTVSKIKKKKDPQFLRSGGGSLCNFKDLI